MLSITQLGKHYGGQRLFQDATVNFNPGSRYGIVGANGSGKSTLLRILTGEEEATEGKVAVARKARIGVLRQDHFEFDDVPILDVVMMGHEELWSVIEAKEKLLEAPPDQFDADKFSKLEEFIQENDGYALEARAAEILEGLNIPTDVHREPLSILSGGFKLRVLLAQTLAGSPDVLLLDEPTNHLDILSIRWLEKFLVSFKGIGIVVSHDHRFLNNVCTHVVDVDYERVTTYKGNYDAFVTAKAENRNRKEAEIEKRGKEIDDHRRFVERFKAKPTKARQAKSKVKQMERIVIETLPPSSRRYPHFALKQCRPCGRIALQLKGISKSYDDKPVLEDVSLKVMRGDKLAIIGPNGIGKSTLLKIAVGVVEQDAGEVEWGYETHPGYFAQDHRALLTEERRDLQSWLWDFCPGESVGFVRNRLARVLFTKDDVEKRIGNLSGGEAARLIFSKLDVTHPNVLVLDEPTNHLDLEGIEALAESLRGYDGTIIFVSHDRWFVSKIATRIVEITPDHIEDFVGSYDEYLERCGDDHLDAEAVLRVAREEKKAAKEARKGQS
ncbi:MAG: ATP-binding cassette domain-containing protein [Acidobacteriota bacterium]|nr:ATP-binding cassette domain-containing protein [Acidobacteriota bacterium]MDH3784899.1 ATP-binding cassette domain-containing protein [Acidobacteriota bacterium]